MKKEKNKPLIKKRRGIYILPNLFTTLNMYCGFISIISSINENFNNAAISILIAVLFDILDGKIARATNTQSQFGLEYDSLSDLISFGLAPGLMIYLWALQPFGRIGWLAAFLFTVCGGLRLARFNTQSNSSPSEYFIGLPIPAAASMAATTVMVCVQYNLDARVSTGGIFLFMLYLLSFLMVSTIKFYSFKKTELFKKMKFNILVSAIILFIFIAAKPALALFLIFFGYVLSGPIFTLKAKKDITDNIEI